MSSEATYISQGSSTGTKFSSRQGIRLLRSIWLLLFILGLMVAALSFYAVFQELNHPAGLNTSPFLSSLNLDYWPLLLYFRILNSLVFLTVALIVLFIFWQRSSDWMAAFISLSIFYQVIALIVPSEAVSPLWDSVLFPLGNVPSVLACFIFPTGRIVPRFARFFIPLLLLGFLMALGYAAFAINFEQSRQILPFVNLGFLGFGSFGLAAQIYRYMRVSTPLQRQQTKVVVYGGVIAFALRGSFVLIPQLFPALVTPPDNLNALAFGTLISTLSALSLLIIPIAIAFSILRYRLWDIDFVINRSLVYASVITLFVLLFAALVAAIQLILGQSQPFSALLTVSVVAVSVFRPLTKRVQHFVDRRIYGFNFDLYELRAAQQKPEIRNAGALTGRKLGQYEVLDFIGKGGMGEVYKGYHEGKTVALKTLARAFAQENNILRRFKREAEVMRDLSHSKIVRLYGAGESEGLPFLVLEYLEGQELRDVLREKGKMSLEDAFCFLRDIAQALDYLHSKGIVHRDIKPGNIMLRGNEAILMDFGIAKLGDEQSQITGSGIIGTIDYIAPEQILASKEVDKRADVYALGVIAYEMLTGERPFKGSIGHVVFAHLQQPAPDPRLLEPDLPETVALAVLRALSKQAEDRYESAGAFVAALG